MDNITHSLAGLLLAESAVRLRAHIEGAEPSPRFRGVAAISSMIAANLPDADLFYTGVGGDRLRYMLHHRGYSHTIMAALVGAVLLWGATMLVRQWRAGERAPPGNARWLLGLLIVSTMSHLVLDWTNSYGVHPFWPVDDRWRYGDAVFIVEPWLWVVSVPTLFLGTRNRLGRVLLALVLFGGLALSWRVALVSRGAATALTIGAVLSVAVALLLRSGTRVMVAIAGWVAVTLVMAAGTSIARAEASGSVHASDPTAELLDIVVSPLPSNAICASVITVERAGAIYRVAVARVTAVPSIVGAAHCGVRDATASMLTPSTRTSTPAVHWMESGAPRARSSWRSHERAVWRSRRCGSSASPSGGRRATPSCSWAMFATAAPRATDLRACGHRGGQRPVRTPSRRGCRRERTYSASTSSGVRRGSGDLLQVVAHDGPCRDAPRDDFETRARKGRRIAGARRARRNRSVEGVRLECWSLRAPGHAERLPDQRRHHAPSPVADPHVHTGE